jgi:hypothetical protein
MLGAIPVELGPPCCRRPRIDKITPAVPPATPTASPGIAVRLLNYIAVPTTPVPVPATMFANARRYVMRSRPLESRACISNILARLAVNLCKDFVDIKGSKHRFCYLLT